MRPHLYLIWCSSESSSSGDEGPQEMCIEKSIIHTKFPKQEENQEIRNEIHVERKQNHETLGSPRDSNDLPNSWSESFMPPCSRHLLSSCTTGDKMTAPAEETGQHRRREGKRPVTGNRPAADLRGGGRGGKRHPAALLVMEHWCATSTEDRRDSSGASELWRGREKRRD